VSVKMVEKEYGLERFVPASLAETMKKKEMQKLLGHFLKINTNMLGPGKLFDLSSGSSNTFNSNCRSKTTHIVTSPTSLP